MVIPNLDDKTPGDRDFRTPDGCDGAASGPGGYRLTHDGLRAHARPQPPPNTANQGAARPRAGIEPESVGRCVDIGRSLDCWGDRAIERRPQAGPGLDSAEQGHTAPLLEPQPARRRHDGSAPSAWIAQRPKVTGHPTAAGRSDQDRRHSLPCVGRVNLSLAAFSEWQEDTKAPMAVVP